MGSGTKIAIAIIGVIVAIALVLGLSIAGTYNGLVQLDQETQKQWAQVENTYQRRADLIPNLVNTVKGAANFEQSTLTAVTEARSRVGHPTCTMDRSPRSNRSSTIMTAVASTGRAVPT